MTEAHFAEHRRRAQPVRIVSDLPDNETCWYAGHVPGCACRAGGDVELRPGWVSMELDGQTVEVEVAP
jgi:hypothetical protein